MTAGAFPPGNSNKVEKRKQPMVKKIGLFSLPARDFVVHAFGQVRILKKAYPGIMHAMLFWGVTIQVLGTVINLMQMQLFLPFVELPFPRGAAYLIYELVMDLAGIAILLGVLMAAFRRIVLRPPTVRTRWDDGLALLLLGLIPLAGFTLESSRLLAAAPEWRAWSPIGNLLSDVFYNLGLSGETAAYLHPYLFWAHAILGLAFIASIPFTKLRHLVATPLNILLRPRRKEGALETIENIEEAEILGVGQVVEFTSRQLLSFDACVNCGRCEEICPAAQSGMPYSPRAFIQSLRHATASTLISGNGNCKGLLLGDILPEDLPWACTTCGACASACPAFVNPIDEIIDLRRYQALTSGKVPKSVADTLRNMECQNNPWGMPAVDRFAWAEGLGVRELAPGDSTDVLLFIGCALAFDARNQKVAQASIRLLQKAGVDFAVLGMDEFCCGETARRLGNEYLFQMFAQQNIETLSKVTFNRIITQCPHCFNTLKNEYPHFGGDYPIYHFSQFLNELSVRKTSPNSSEDGLQRRLTYHDSCYLGRYNQVYAEPRRLLDLAKPTRVEMARKEQDSFCCGGGGGQMWMETDPGTRINHRRLADAMEKQVDLIATACPYCLLMFDDAIRSKGLGEVIQVMDLAEIIQAEIDSERISIP